MSQRAYTNSPGGRLHPVDSLASRARQEHDKHPVATDVAAGGAALFGMKTGSYVKGARVLRTMDDARAGQLAHQLNHATHGRKDLFRMAQDMKSPGDALGAVNPLKPHLERHKAFGQVKGQVSPQHHKPLGEMKSAADLWADTHQGVGDARRVAQGKFAPIDALNFNHRPKHRLMQKVVDNAPKNSEKLYRGMSMKSRPKVGDEIHMDQSSWSSNKDVADLYERAQSTPKAVKRNAGKGAGDRPVTLHLPEGHGRSVKIDGLTRTAQAEHVAPKGRYRVIHDDGQHIHVQRVEDHVQKNDPFGLEISKAKNLTQDQINRRKKAQGNISLTTATLGLTGLGLLGAGAAAPKLAQVAGRSGKLRPINARKVEEFSHRAKESAKTVGVISGGVGGVGGYNFASYTKAEARQRKQKGM